MSDQLTPEEARALRELLDIEKIRKLKLLYSQLMDSRDIDALVEILSEDAVCEFGPYGTWRGKTEIHEGWKAVFTDREPYSGFHVTTNQWVELTGPDSAVSRAYLIDTVHAPDPRSFPVIWFGLYDEKYARIDGDWKMTECTLQYLWPQRMLTDVDGAPWPGPFPPKS